MNNISCQNCHTSQPSDYRTGDRCIACGDAVREDVNCGWCVHLVPNTKFCRDCGFEMVDAQLFGVARMLKDSGIDKLSLAQKVRELPADITVHYKTIYNKHYGILLNQIEQVRLCEEYLLHKQYSFALEQEYLKKIPFDDDTLDFLSQGPKGNFKSCPERIPEIISQSPLQMTGWYATIAGISAPINWEPKYEQDRFRQLEKLFLGAQMNNNPMLIDVIVGFAHWRMLPLLMANRQYPKLKGAWNSLLLEFVTNNWESLSRVARQCISPLVCRLSSFNNLPERYQEDIQKHLLEAEGSFNSDLQFAAACSTLNGAILFKTVEEASRKSSLLAAQVILDYNLPQQTALLLQHKDEQLQTLAFKEIRGQQRLAFQSPSLDETIAKALIQYLKEDKEQRYRNEAIEILGRYSQYTNEIGQIAQQQTGVSNNPEVLLQTIKSTQDSSLIATLTDQLLQIEVSQKTLQAIDGKTRKVELSEFAIIKITDYATSDHFNENCQFIIQSILKSQLQQQNHASFFVLKGILNGIFIKNSETVFKMSRNLSFGGFKAAFVCPGKNEVTNFAVNQTQLKWFFDDLSLFVKSFSQKITVSDIGDLSWYYQGFWEPYQKVEWPELLSKNSDDRSQIIAAWLHVVYNATLSGSYRAYGIKALESILPVMSKEEKGYVQGQITEVPMKEGDMFYLIERWNVL